MRSKKTQRLLDFILPLFPAPTRCDNQKSGSIMAMVLDRAAQYVEAIGLCGEFPCNGCHTLFGQRQLGGLRVARAFAQHRVREISA